MRLCLTVALSSLTLAVLSTSAFAELQITVDKSAQQMTVAVDGQPRYTWSVSTGYGGYDTPSGTYQPFRMEASHFSREWDNAPMPHSIFFTKIGHAIHGTNHVKNLGRAASHGCVRLAPGNAATLFSLVKAQGMSNTRVTVEGNNEPAVASNGARVRQDRYAEDDAASAGTRASRGGARYRAQPAARPVQYRDPFGGDYYGGGYYGGGYGYGYSNGYNNY